MLRLFLTISLSVSGCFSDNPFRGSQSADDKSSDAQKSKSNQPNETETHDEEIKTGGAGDPIDNDCLKEAKTAERVFLDKTTPKPKTVPSNCRVGFEINNPGIEKYVLSGAGPNENLTLEVDLATYHAPDGIKITGTVGDKTYILFNSCRISTATYTDPTGGKVRPPDDSIRDFRPILRKGTTKLEFDFTGVGTPVYFSTLGLCNYTITAPSGLDPASETWRKLN